MVALARIPGLTHSRVLPKPLYFQCPPLDSLGGPKIDYSSLGDELEKTLELLSETGYTS